MNENFSALEKNYLFAEVAARTAAYRARNPGADIISLGIGDVTLPLAGPVVAAMRAAVEEMGRPETFRGYGPDFGYDFLRRAIADNYARLGAPLEPGEVYVSDGAKSDCGNILDIFGSSPVLMPDPVYPVYRDSATMAGRRIVVSEATAENGFLPPPPDSDESAVAFLCSPNNPTGAVYDMEGLRAWVDWANACGSVIIFDAAYEAFITGTQPHSIFCVPGAESCAIEIGSFSKSAGFTGTRCSWTVIPSKLERDGKSVAELWKRRQATKFNGVAYVIQRGAQAALSPEGREACGKQVGCYLDNAAVISGAFKSSGVAFTGGQASPYIWMRCPDGMDSWSFFDLLLDKGRIVGTPGAGFGKNGQGFLRLTAFNTREATEEAARRLVKLLG